MDSLIVTNITHKALTPIIFQRSNAFGSPCIIYLFTLQAFCNQLNSKVDGSGCTFNEALVSLLNIDPSAHKLYFLVYSFFSFICINPSFQSSAIKCSKYDVVFTSSSCIYRFISKTAYYKPIRMPQYLKPEPLAPSNYSLVEVPTTGRRCSNKALCIGSYVAARLCARLNWFASLNL